MNRYYLIGASQVRTPNVGKMVALAVPFALAALWLDIVRRGR